MRSWYALRRLTVMGEGIRVAVVFSVCHLLRFSPCGRDTAVNVGRLVKRTARFKWAGIPAGAPRAKPTNAPARVRTTRGQTLRPRRPVAGAINSSHRRVPSSRRGQLRTAERRPAGEGLKHSNRRTGPRKKDLNTPTIGPALLAESYVKSAAAALPLGPTSRYDPGLRDAPRFLGRETLEKPDNGTIINRSDDRMEGFRRPPAQSVQFSSRKVH